ncbi:MAG: chloride channel protein [Marinobacter sp.]|uniref:chloride channel protein n=1 Tax=Marinobacter sp. TaxID=50741 RepID=UPI00299DF4A1|nr:chloride channel protein [Marinobacter sp.]MDX1756121.1 chloride channel protein [Marinobacter sp.]
MARLDVQQAAYRILVVSAVAVVVGTVASLAAIAFVEALHFLNDRLLISPYARIQMDHRPLWLMAATVLVPTLGGLLVGIIVRWGVDERRGLTPADAILAVQTRRPPPRLRSGLVSSLAALLSLGSGASVGQYGPLAFLGAHLGGLAGRLRLRLKNLQAIAIACGVAAAISTAFNAPIAGLVFAHEVILRHYSLRAFAPVTVAAAIGYVVDNVLFDRPPLFRVNFLGVEHSYEFVLFAVEGVLCAGLAVAFILLLQSSGRLAQCLPLPDWGRPAAAGLVLGLVALWLPEVLGIGQETLRFATIESAFAVHELALIVVAKLALTALCIGFGFVGGVFSPALLIGILFGALYGVILPLVLPVPLSGQVVYAVCGMMAMASAVIGAPLTTILIVFELTRSYDLTIAAMVAVVFSNLVSYRVMGRSIFDIQLRERGFDLSLGRDKAILGTHPVRDFISERFTTATEGEEVAAVRDRLVKDRRSEAMLLDARGLYLGTLHLQDLDSVPVDQAIRTLASSPEVLFHEDTTVWQSMELLQGFLGEAVPMVATDGRLLGVVPEEAVIRAYLEIIHDLRQEENEAA